ncbi:MAG: cache domain-containing protein [Pseudomonadota bacterium]
MKNHKSPGSIKPATRISIAVTAFLSMLSIALLAVFVMAGFWISHNIWYADTQSGEFIQSHTREKKNLAKNLVDDACHQVDVQRDQLRDHLKSKLKSRAHNAVDIARSIVDNNASTMNPMELRRVVKDALRPMRFFNDRGFYIAASSNGAWELFPPAPDQEGKPCTGGPAQGFPFMAAIQELQGKGEGFVELASGISDHPQPCILYIVYFEPFDWFLGCHDDQTRIETDLQQELLNRMAHIRKGQDGYLFVLDSSGVFLMHPIETDLKGENILNVTLTDGDAFYRQMKQAAAAPQGDFITYSWKKPSTGKVTPKISFLRAIPEWNWIIGSGVYLDDIETGIREKKDQLNQQLIRQMTVIAGIALSLLVLILLIAGKIKVKAAQSFEQFSSFFRDAASGAGEIDGSTLHYTEFQDLAALANTMVQEREKLFQDLRESEKRFRTLLDTTPTIAVQGYRQDLIVDYWNRGSELFYGYTRQQAVGQNLLDLIVPDDLKSSFKDAVSRALESNTITSIQEVVLRRKDNTTIPVLSSRAILRPRGKDPVLYSMDMDLSAIRRGEKERERLQEQLARTRKMEAMGLLAGGVAHDLNNILSGIVSYPELLLLNDNLDMETRKALEIIQSSGNKAAAVVSDLITIARGVAATMEPVSLNTAVMNYLGSPEQASLMKSYPWVTVLHDLDPEALHINASPVHINKIIMNLVYNGVEAVEQTPEPEVILSSRNRFLDTPVRGYDRVVPGEYTELSVSDNGPGIQDADLERIFEPFSPKRPWAAAEQDLALPSSGISSRTTAGILMSKQALQGPAFSCISGPYTFRQDPIASTPWTSTPSRETTRPSW